MSQANTDRSRRKVGLLQVLPHASLDCSRMTSASLFLGILVLLPAVNEVWGDGCTGLLTLGFPVINMCEQKSSTLGRAHLGVTTDTMGNNTRCGCILRSKTPGSNTTTFFYLKATDSRASKCNQSLIHITPFDRVLEYYAQTFTCTTPLDSTSYTGITTNDVIITLTRPDTSVAVSYCVLVQPDRYTENDMELFCESGVTSSTSNSTSSSTPPSTASSSSTPSSSMPSSSSLASSQMTSSSQSPTSTPVSLTSTTLPQGQGVSTGNPSSTVRETTEGQNSLMAGALAGIVLGAIALICLTVIVIVISIVYIRYRTKLLSSRQNGTDNSAYTSLSDVTRVNPRADPNYAVIQSKGSSSQPSGNDATSATGVYEPVEDASTATREDSQTGSGTYYNV